MAIDHLASDVEYYDSAEDIFKESDLVETDVHIQGWNRKFRIRALSFKLQEEINQKATDKDSGELNHQEWVLWTIVHGVIRPRITYDQAKGFLEKNGTFVNNLADDIWAIGRISKSIFDDYIANLKTLSELEKAQKK
jgi:hypothetical protein